MSLHIRFAGPDDAETVLGFIHALAVFENEPDAVEATPETLRRQMSQERPPFECLLAEWDGEAVGFALFFPTYSTWRGRPGMYLEDLFVPEEHRGRGVGRGLLRRVAAIAVERGCARFEWAVLDWNEPAIGFYEKLGAEVLPDWRVCRVTGKSLDRLATMD